MDESKLDEVLGKFLIMEDGSRYCVLNKKTIDDGRHFISAVTVPGEDGTMEDLENVEFKLLQLMINEKGELSVAEYLEINDDYQDIVDIFLKGEENA